MVNLYKIDAAIWDDFSNQGANTYLGKIDPKIINERINFLKESKFLKYEKLGNLIYQIEKVSIDKISQLVDFFIFNFEKNYSFIIIDSEKDLDFSLEKSKFAYSSLDRYTIVIDDKRIVTNSISDFVENIYNIVK